VSSKGWLVQEGRAHKKSMSVLDDGRSDPRGIGSSKKTWPAIEKRKPFFSWRRDALSPRVTKAPRCGTFGKILWSLLRRGP